MRRKHLVIISMCMKIQMKFHKDFDTIVHLTVSFLSFHIILANQLTMASQKATSFWDLRNQVSIYKIHITNFHVIRKMIWSSFLRTSLLYTVPIDKILSVKHARAWVSMVSYLKKTSPKGFSASKCDVGNWTFSKS